MHTHICVTLSSRCVSRGLRAPHTSLHYTACAASCLNFTSLPFFFFFLKGSLRKSALFGDGGTRYLEAYIRSTQYSEYYTGRRQSVAGIFATEPAGVGRGIELNSLLESIWNFQLTIYAVGGLI